MIGKLLPFPYPDCCDTLGVVVGASNPPSFVLTNKSLSPNTSHDGNSWGVVSNVPCSDGKLSHCRCVLLGPATKNETSNMTIPKIFIVLHQFVKLQPSQLFFIKFGNDGSDALGGLDNGVGVCFDGTAELLFNQLLLLRESVYLNT